MLTIGVIKHGVHLRLGDAIFDVIVIQHAFPIDLHPLVLNQAVFGVMRRYAQNVASCQILAQHIKLDAK